MIAWVAAERSVRTIEQAPAESVQVATVVAPLRRVTVPVGVVPSEALDAIANVIASPYVVETALGTTVVVVGDATIWLIVPDALGA